MRLFIAVEAPEDIHNYFFQLQNQISNDIAKMALTKSFHLTLKFLGEVDEPKKDSVIELLRKVKFEHFTAELSDMGVFPNEDYIRILWVGLEPKGKIIKLQQKIDDPLVNLFPKDKRFHPHITLGRIRFVKDKKGFIELLKSIKIDKKSFEVNSFKLVKSTLTPEGPFYEVLAEYKSVS